VIVRESSRHARYALGNRAEALMDYDLGILFVHGIGQQRRGETLVNFGEPLQEWLRRWLTRDEGEDSIVEWQDARLSAAAETSGAPPYTRGIWKLPNRRCRVLMAECWWADAFGAPSFGELFVWLREAALVTLSQHFSARLRRQWRRTVDPASAGMRRLWEASKVGREIIYFLVGWPLLATMLLAFLVLMFVVNLVPGTGRVVKRIQFIMAATVGDSYAFLKRPIQRVAVTGQFHRDLRWVADQCDRVAVVAHSQGAAVTHVALRQGLPDGLNEENCLLITLGSGLKKLEELAEIRDKRESMGRATLGGLLLMLAGAWLKGWLPFPAPRQEWVEGWWGWLLGVGGFFWLTDVLRTLQGIELPVDRLAPLTAFGKAILWLDYYGLADPVSNGPLLTKQPTFMRSQCVNNRNSNFSDHTSYWQNMEQFTGSIALAVGGLVDAELRSEVEQQWMDLASKLRFRRVTALAWTRALVTMSSIALLAVLWLQDRLTPLGELAFSKATALGTPPGKFVAGEFKDLTIWLHPALFGMAVIAVTTIVVFQALRVGLWASWQKHDIDHYFSRRAYEPFSVTAGLYLGSIFALVGILLALGLRLLPLPGEAPQWTVARVVTYATVPGFVSAGCLFWWGIWRVSYVTGCGLGLTSFGVGVPLMLLLIRSPLLDRNVDLVSSWALVFLAAIIVASFAATRLMTAPFLAIARDSRDLASRLAANRGTEAPGV